MLSSPSSASSEVGIQLYQYDNNNTFALNKTNLPILIKSVIE